MTITTFKPEFKGLREFNKKGLVAIVLELTLNLDYDDEELVDNARFLIKALINHTPNFNRYSSVSILQDHLKLLKPDNMTWRDFETYSRYNYDDFILEII